MLRKIVTIRRVLHGKRDVMCTMLLLVLFCLLLYARQVRLEQSRHRERGLWNHLSASCSINSQPYFQAVLSAGWDPPAWKLGIHGSTSSSRTLLGTSMAKEGHESPGVWPDLIQVLYVCACSHVAIAIQVSSFSVQCIMFMVWHFFLSERNQTVLRVQWSGV